MPRLSRRGYDGWEVAVKRAIRYRLALLTAQGARTGSRENRVIDAFAVEVGGMLHKRRDQRMRIILER